jgi:hypothetical protein
MAHDGMRMRGPPLIHHRFSGEGAGPSDTQLYSFSQSLSESLLITKQDTSFSQICIYTLMATSIRSSLFPSLAGFQPWAHLSPRSTGDAP